MKKFRISALMVQPPHVSYFMGEGMLQPPKPNIVSIKKSKKY
jgi:hypothetical protein